MYQQITGVHPRCATECGWVTLRLDFSFFIFHIFNFNFSLSECYEFCYYIFCCVLCCLLFFVFWLGVRLCVFMCAKIWHTASRCPLVKSLSVTILNNYRVERGWYILVFFSSVNWYSYYRFRQVIMKWLFFQETVHSIDTRLTHSKYVVINVLHYLF